jgi:hypothetical protein
MVTLRHQFINALPPGSAQVGLVPLDKEGPQRSEHPGCRADIAPTQQLCIEHFHWFAQVLKQDSLKEFGLLVTPKLHVLFRAVTIT